MDQERTQLRTSVSSLFDSTVSGYPEYASFHFNTLMAALRKENECCRRRGRSFSTVSAKRVDTRELAPDDELINLGGPVRKGEHPGR